MILVGGLGGGGDSGGALSLALAIREAGAEVAILGMVSCRVRDLWRAEPIEGSLVRVTEKTWAGGRFFEPHIASMGWETYVICLNEPIKLALEGLKKLKQDGARTLIGVDFGGDALVRGDEPEVGSAAADAAGLAILVRAARELGMKTLLAAGAVGAEGGGCIPMELLAENVLELARSGGYLGSYEPRGKVKREFLEAASHLLKKVPSFMLTVYVDALRGNLGERFYSVAYFHGMFRIVKHYKYLYVFDPVKVCEMNSLCQAALKGGKGGAKAAMRRRRIGTRKGVKDWERLMLRLAAKRWDYRSVIS